MSGVSVSVTGLDEVRKYFRNLSSQLPIVAANAATQMASHIAERAEENAPVLTGDLREGITAVSATVQAHIAQAAVRVDDTIEYAAPMALHLTPYGQPVGVSKSTGMPIYSLGPISSRQPNTEEGGVGGHWIERVAKYHLDAYATALKDAVESIH